MSTDYSKPQAAPETVLAADGQTVLKRFRVDAVIFAPDQATAQRRLSQIGLYLDAAALKSGEGAARLYGLTADEWLHLASEGVAMTSTPDRDYMKEVMASRATVSHLGKEMMDRWNLFERNHPLFSELAVMGHEDNGGYTFIVQSNGNTFEFTARELESE
jgi:hypothetical protein